MNSHPPARRATNVGSILLTPQENDCLFGYLGRKCAVSLPVCLPPANSKYVQIHSLRHRVETSRCTLPASVSLYIDMKQQKASPDTAEAFKTGAQLGVTAKSATLLFSDLLTLSVKLLLHDVS